MISGTAKGHKLKTVKGMTTRPTSDMVKESLFNILAAYIPDSDILDLFAGTGSLGIEALSRGARSAVFSDKSRECAAMIKQNLEHTKLMDKAVVHTSDFTDILNRLWYEGKKFDIIFLDPPYSKNFIQETLKNMTKNDIIRDNGILAAEHQAGDILPEQEGRLRLVKSQKYGGTVLSFYKCV